MANRKVSELPVASTTKTTDSYMVVQDGVSKKISFGTLIQNFKATVNFIFDVTAASTIDFIIQSGATKIFKVKGSNLKVGIKNENPESDLHIHGNLQIGAINGSAQGVYIGSIESVAHPTSPTGPALITPSISNPISNDFETTLITTYENSNYLLPSGIPGQIKTLIHAASTSSTPGQAIINFSANSSVGFNKITLPKVGDSVTLKYVSSKWHVIGQFGASITTVS